MKFIFNNISKSIIKNLLDNKYAVAGVSGVVLLLGSYAAHAQVASVSAAVNLRQGPGAGYGRIAALPRGVNVHINSCRGGWCQIRSSWGVGWVSGRYLLRGYAGSNYAPNYAPAYDSDYSAPQSQVIFGLNIGSGYSDDDYYSPYYRPNYRPYYHPNYGPGYRPVFGPGYRPFGPRYRPDGPRYFPRPGGREGWNPRWGVGPVHLPLGGWHR